MVINYAVVINGSINEIRTYSSDDNSLMLNCSNILILEYF